MLERGLMATDARKMRTDSVLATLKKAKEDYENILFDKFLYEIQIRWGLTEKLARDYLKVAMGSLGAHIENGEIGYAKEVKIDGSKEVKIDGSN